MQATPPKNRQLCDFPAHAPVALRRTVRLAIALEGRAARSINKNAPPPTASTARFLHAHHEVLVECRGVPDPGTGYLIGIQDIDAAVRAGAEPLLTAWLRGDTDAPSRANAVRELARATQDHLPPSIRLASLTWCPGPLASIAWTIDMPDHALVSERFEFSASHRLHCPDRTDEENRRLFGKCNNPNGHGHNYRIEVTARVPVGNGTDAFPEGRLGGVVRREVIDRFDHRHLNVDCPEFASLNPSVEHIAMVCHGLLEPALRAAGTELHRVTVWETEKTSATYPVR